jgi:hypothetical protein
MSFAQVNEQGADGFGTEEYYETISPLNKTSKFFFNVDTKRLAVLRGVPSLGQVLTYSDNNEGTWKDPDELNYSTMTPSGTISAGVAGPESGASGLTITNPAPSVVQLALSETNVDAGTYGSSTQIPQITFDAQGRAQNASTVAIAPPSSIGSIPTRTVRVGVGTPAVGNSSTFVGDGAGSFGAVSTGSNAVFVGADSGPVNAADSTLVSIGSNVRAGLGSVVVGNNASSGQNSVVIGRLSSTSGDNSVVLGVNQSTNINDTILIGSASFARGADNIAIGRGIATNAATVAAVDNIAVGRNHLPSLTSGSGNIVVGRTCAGSLTTGANNVFLGNTAGANTVSGSSNVAIGLNAGPLDSVASTSVSIGPNTLTGASGVAVGSSTQATGQNAVGIGVSTVASGQPSIAIGRSTVATAVRSFAIGDGITNSVGNSMLLGTNTAPTDFILRSTGVFKSFQSVGAAAGRAPTEANQVIATYPEILTFANIRYSYPAGLPSLILQTIALGTFPDDLNATFSVSATISANSSVPSAVYRFRLLWGANPLPELTLAYQAVDCVNSVDVSTTLCANIRVPATSTAANTVRVVVDKITGPPATLTIVDYRLQVNRFA